MKIYRCKVCGQIMLVLNEGAGTPKCCDQDMELLTPKTTESETGEKHIPCVKTAGCYLKVKIGEEEHPHSKSHYIQWILVETGEGYQIKYLCPTESPVACFKVNKHHKPVAIYAYCNIHGLWAKKLDT